MKKIFYMTIAVMLVILSFNLLTVSAAESFGDFKYFIENGYAQISRYTGTDEDVIVPSEINGYPVIGIGIG